MSLILVSDFCHVGLCTPAPLQEGATFCTGRLERGAPVVFGRGQLQTENWRLVAEEAPGREVFGAARHSSTDAETALPNGLGCRGPLRNPPCGCTFRPACDRISHMRPPRALSVVTERSSFKRRCAPPAVPPAFLQWVPFEETGQAACDGSGFTYWSAWWVWGIRSSSACGIQRWISRWHCSNSGLDPSPRTERTGCAMRAASRAPSVGSHPATSD